jgi:hypothetical protein
MLKQSQKRTNRAALREASMSRHAGQHHRLVGDDADGGAFHADEAAQDVLGVVFLDLEEVALVGHLGISSLHVVGLVRIGRDQRVERFLDALAIVAVGTFGGFFAVGQRQEVDQAAHLSSASTSFSKARRRPRTFPVWVEAPPSSSAVTISLVTVFTTSGPVTNM